MDCRILPGREEAFHRELAEVLGPDIERAWDELAPVVSFGFAPLRLPGELDFTALFHGVDERVPVAGLEFGTAVLDHFLRNC